MRVLSLIFLLIATTAYPQQVADSLFHFDNIQPRYASGNGPLILLDEGHHNFHTTTGRFKPFCDFLRKDGYILHGYPKKFSEEGLKPCGILVIANALNEVNQAKWTLPTPSAFTDAEISVLESWVRQGGSLFLIADHMPFPGASERLAAAFGFTFYNGFALRKSRVSGTLGNELSIPDVFTIGNGLEQNQITQGNLPEERITSVRTFTGQAFEIPSEAVPLLVLDNTYELLLPETAWEFKEKTTTRPASGLAQGAFLKYGKGRLVVFGEAAMFSAQIQRDTVRMGMNAPNAKQNPQFLLNIIHWLDGPLK